MLRAAVAWFIAVWIVGCYSAWGQESGDLPPLVVTPSNVSSPPLFLFSQAEGTSVVKSPVSSPIEDSLQGMIDTSAELHESVLEITDVPAGPVTNMSDPLDASEMDRLRRVPTQASNCYLSDADCQCEACGASACHSNDCLYCNAYRSHLGPLARVKAHLQRSHWGYCNYFDVPPFGSSVIAGATKQIRRGLEDSMMLYHYDFYPAESGRAAELTPRGRSQLLKLLDRMQFSAVPIQVQATDDNVALDRERIQHVINSLALFGARNPSDLVVLAPLRHQGYATESGITYENSLQSVISRGRTIRPSQSATFGSQ